MQPNTTALFMFGYAIAAPNLQNYGSQGRRGLNNDFNSIKEIEKC
jgi:hypothetical protein